MTTVGRPANPQVANSNQQPSGGQGSGITCDEEIWPFGEVSVYKIRKGARVGRHRAADGSFDTKEMMLMKRFAIGFAFALVVHGGLSLSAQGDMLPLQMGLFNPNRLAEPVLREIWGFMEDMGQRAFLFAAMDAGMNSGGNTTYTITLTNRGMTNIGLAAEDITVSLRIPEGTSVVSATGGSYEGIRNGVETVTNPRPLSPFRGLNPNPDVQRAKVDFATRQVAKVAAGQEQQLTVTLSGVGDAPPEFSGSRITFNKPVVRRLPSVTLTDDRLADQGDILWGPSLEFTLPRAPRR